MHNEVEPIRQCNDVQCTSCIMQLRMRLVKLGLAMHMA